MANKTEEDWFLRGGERPPADTENGCSDDPVCQNCGNCWPADAGETCPVCGASLTGGASTAECCGADDGDGGGEPKTYIVTVTRTKTVDQHIKIRVTAKDEDTAEDIAMNIAETEDDADWTDDEGTVDYGYAGIEDVVEVVE